jgi:propanol-preferring alcohol dehydrogenase
MTSLREDSLPDTMTAMRIHRVAPITQNSEPLSAATVQRPEPGSGEVLIKVMACGVCHTEIDEIEGRTTPPSLPRTPGHQVCGTVVSTGPDCPAGLEGKVVGVAWIWSACGSCAWCRQGEENLCGSFIACGRDVDGGYAEFMVAPASYVHPLPPGLASDIAAPLLCAGAVGYRSLRLTGLNDGDPLGLTGFGASGHLVLQMAKHLFPASPVAVYARSENEQAFALELGANWAGGTEDRAPFRPQAIIDTTPAWRPVRFALQELRKGGRLVINAIRKESFDQQDLVSIDYSTHLWMEKSIKSVANVTREDVRQCLALAVEVPLEPVVTRYPLAGANQALREIRHSHQRGARVLVME